ncbi:hypothetical protein K2F40_08840 [Clostridium sp. CM028]|uniref:hypothetical protein n=1 Tax=Clostridium sp. CM028 TaxID=2851575 RepID=UPI001C6E5B3B|nr:hypothetical protein [Clostridium sp. CM028]MBW9149064.1 hypothetical protein [Clostridium sp. CM028]WLC62670.1 hypothetical protein KTC94_05210 [Clostridium sp. CM028]
MSPLETKNLYRIEITERCYCTLIGATGNAMPSFESVEKNGNYGSIPIGVKGWVVEKFGMKYFRPDENQGGIDLFTPSNQPIVLIPYYKISGHYKRI